MLTAAEVQILDGALVTTAELNLSDGVIGSITITPAQGGTNECDVTIALLDAAGVALTTNLLLDVYLSDDAAGRGITGTGASGTVQAQSGEGADLVALVAKKYLKVNPKVTVGTYVLEITDSAKTGFYVCVVNPFSGEVVVSAQLVSGDYG